MSTKQLRLSDASQIRNRIPELVGKKINLVLTNNTVQTGTLESSTDAYISLRNMRLKKVEFSIKDIAEIYFDTLA
jgi:hypothetical protein